MAAVVPDEPWIPLSGTDPDGADGWFDHTWPGRTWTVGSFIVRVIDAEPPIPVDNEVSRAEWLGERLSCPGPVVTEGRWLAADVVGATAANRPEAQPEPDLVPAAIGEGLRTIHDLDPDSCPFTRSWAETTAELAAMIKAGRVRSAALREPYSRYEPERLMELIAEGEPDGHDLVVTHGGATLSNLLLAPDAPVTFIGVHRLGVADRHVDLAVITNQLQAAFGPESLYGFYEAYGRDPDLVRLDHYLLIDAVAAAVDQVVVR